MFLLSIPNPGRTPKNVIQNWNQVSTIHSFPPQHTHGLFGDGHGLSAWCHGRICSAPKTLSMVVWPVRSLRLLVNDASVRRGLLVPEGYGETMSSIRWSEGSCTGNTCRDFRSKLDSVCFLSLPAHMLNLFNPDADTAINYRKFKMPVSNYAAVAISIRQSDAGGRVVSDNSIYKRWAHAFEGWKLNALFSGLYCACCQVQLHLQSCGHSCCFCWF